MIPELTAFEKSWNTDVWTQQLYQQQNSLIPYFKCILTTTLILKIVTSKNHNNKFNNV
jgi:hypothetical protein